MSNTAWVHNLDPFLLQFSAGVGIRWYGTAYMAGFLVGAYIMMWLARRGRDTLPAERVFDYVTYVVLGTMLGGRIGYVVFYSPDLLLRFDAHIPGTQIPMWSAIAVWEGGMASHGGIIGIICAALLFAKRNKLDWLHLGDLTTLGGTVGIFSGRVANFINGELFGRECAPGFPMAVKFPQEMERWLSVEPQKLKSISSVVPQIGISSSDWETWVSQIGIQPGMRDRVESGILRLIDAIQNGNESIREALGVFLTPRYPSQLFEGALEGLLVFLVLIFFWYKPRKPGVVGALFLTVYAFVRIVGEQFRLPDAHISHMEFAQFGVTRGQLISIAMLILSGLFLWWTSRRKVPLISGWGPEAQKLRSEQEPKASSSHHATTKNKKPRK